MKRNGFSLIELLVVIAIIAILAAILFPIFLSAKQRGKCASCLSNCRQVGTAMMNYASDWSGWIPRPSWNDWTQPDTSKPCPYSGYEELLMGYVKTRKVFICPAQDKVLVSGSTTWAKFQPFKNPSQKGFISYGYNEAIVYPSEPWLKKADNSIVDRRCLSDFPTPSRTILLAENNSGWHDTWDGKTGYVFDSFTFDNLDRERHGDKSVFIFCDGHAAVLKAEATNKPNNLWTINPGD